MCCWDVVWCKRTITNTKTPDIFLHLVMLCCSGHSMFLLSFSWCIKEQQSLLQLFVKMAQLLSLPLSADSTDWLAHHQMQHSTSTAMSPSNPDWILHYFSFKIAGPSLISNCGIDFSPPKWHKRCHMLKVDENCIFVRCRKGAPFTVDSAAVSTHLHTIDASADLPLALFVVCCLNTRQAITHSCYQRQQELLIRTGLWNLCSYSFLIFPLVLCSELKAV